MGNVYCEQGGPGTRLTLKVSHHGELAAGIEFASCHTYK